MVPSLRILARRRSVYGAESPLIYVDRPKGRRRVDEPASPRRGDLSAPARPSFPVRLETAVPHGLPNRPSPARRRGAVERYLPKIPLRTPMASWPTSLRPWPTLLPPDLRTLSALPGVCTSMAVISG